jgi:hypothetical protein
MFYAIVKEIELNSNTVLINILALVLIFIKQLSHLITDS